MACLTMCSWIGTDTLLRKINVPQVTKEHELAGGGEGTNYMVP